MAKISWQFDENRAHEPEGFNNPGISHFTAHRLDGLVREAIQNSLDARADDDRPVRVTFTEDRVRADTIDAKSLEKAIHESLESEDNDSRHKESLNGAAKTLLLDEYVSALKIEDANTLGAEDGGGVALSGER